jgi:hypothetical protein
MLQMVFTAHSSKIGFTFKLLNCQILYKSLTFYQPESELKDYGSYQIWNEHHTFVKVAGLDILSQNLLSPTELPIANLS